MRRNLLTDTTHFLRSYLSDDPICLRDGPLIVTPRVSVVIPAYNAADTLPRLLLALRKQTVSPQEIIVVDDYSRDLTAAVAASLGARVLMHSKNRGPGMSRNTGVQESKGEILVFTDSDCIPPPDWIERSLKFMKKMGARVTTSGYLGPVGTDLSCWFQHWEKRYREPFEPRPIYATNGHNLAIEKSLYLDVGGMEGIRTNEDFLFGLKVSDRTPIYYDPDNGVYHHFRADVHSFFRQKILFAQNGLLCSRKVQFKMSQRATFSPWRTVWEIGLTLCTLGLIFAFLLGVPEDRYEIVLLAPAFLAARVIPFLIFLRRHQSFLPPPPGVKDQNPKNTVPALLYLYSPLQLLIRDIALLIGLIRGFGLLLIRKNLVDGLV